MKKTILLFTTLLSYYFIYCQCGNPTASTELNINNAKLHVNGKAVFREAVVRPDGWNDFVFDENYELLPLEEVKAFIQENKHLPDVPSEKQVLDEGVSVGKMDAILLQKIEELTLYILQLEEEINKLKNK